MRAEHRREGRRIRRARRRAESLLGPFDQLAAAAAIAAAAMGPLVQRFLWLAVDTAAARESAAATTSLPNGRWNPADDPEQWRQREEFLRTRVTDRPNGGQA